MKKKESIFSEELTGIKVGRPANYAAGPLAVKKSLEHLQREMGLKRAFEAINQMNKKGGFDCPGCAWPDPDDKRSVLGEYCENGAKALAEEATLSRVDTDFFKEHSISEMRTWSDFEIGKSGRLTAPMIVREGQDHYEEITWEEAFTTIGKTLQSLDDPNEAIFYTSGRSSNEAAYLYGLMARRLGTNNLPDCSNMCHESSGVALSQTLGIGKGSVKLDDLHEAEVIIIMGQNPGTNHPRMLTALQKAKENNAKIISINPLEEAGLKRFRNPQRPMDLLLSGTAITDVYLQVKINQDVSLLKAIMIDLLEREEWVGDILDTEFIEQYTSGWDELKADLSKYSKEELLALSGISPIDFERATSIIAPSNKIIICWAMGLTQHKNAVDNIKECVNLLLLKGSLGKPGAGTCPVRGHSNVQGDRTVGINHNIPKTLAKNIKEVYKFQPPLESGYDIVKAMPAMHEGKAKVFSALGGNIIGAMSDTQYCIDALERCDMTINISTKLNRTHLHHGKTGIILPTLGRSEKDKTAKGFQFVSVENSMGKVHSSEGVLAPASNKLMSEPAIICKIADATFEKDTHVPWNKYADDYSLIRKDIARVVSGFSNYNKKISGKKEFYLPNNVRDLDFSKLPDGKAQFSVCPLPEHNLRRNEYLLMTIRSHDQFNTTIYGLDDRYRGIYNERRVLLMNKEDMKIHKLKKLDLVDMQSNYNNVTRSVSKFHIVPYDIPRGNLAAYFPETNPLIPIDQYADHSYTPISKSVKVRVIKRSE